MGHGVEIPIGTKIIIDDKLCIVKEGRSCSRCAVQKMTACRTNTYGASLKCGTKKTGNTTDFLCSKDNRTDGKNILFESIE